MQISLEEYLEDEVLIKVRSPKKQESNLAADISLELLLELLLKLKLISIPQYRISKSKRNEKNDFSNFMKTFIKIFQLTGDIEEFLESVQLYTNKPSVKRRNTWSASLVISENQDDPNSERFIRENENGQKSPGNNLFYLQDYEEQEQVQPSMVHRYSKTSNIFIDDLPIQSPKLDFINTSNIQNSRQIEIKAYKQGNQLTKQLFYSNTNSAISDNTENRSSILLLKKCSNNNTKSQKLIERNQRKMSELVSDIGSIGENNEKFNRSEEKGDNDKMSFFPSPKFDIKSEKKKEVYAKGVFRGSSSSVNSEKGKNR